jgi:hypothetical protein
MPHKDCRSKETHKIILQKRAAVMAAAKAVITAAEVQAVEKT